MSNEKKESADFKIGQLRLPNLKNRKEKIKSEQLKRPLGHQAYQFLHSGYPRRKGGRG